MKVEEISKVAKILNEWNSLGEAADSVVGLDGYRSMSSASLRPINFNVKYHKDQVDWKISNWKTKPSSR